MNVLRPQKGRLIRLVRREDGNSIVELAVVFPLLLLLFVGIAELGRLFYTYTTLAKASKVGARYLSASRDATSASASNVATATLEAQSLVVCGYTNCAGNQPDGSPKVPIVPGLDINDPAANVEVTLPDSAAAVKYVKVEIKDYPYPPGIFNLAGMVGKEDATFYFPLTPGTEMRYMP
ncbi:MAG TPA: TadE/TadG family type IV pilus assembly protein [Pyrinomonadaceae bacterium]|nr:TadE/TadG family type IV pilus assembly protein [Pyrinomonadaceae bacterium]